MSYPPVTSGNNDGAGEINHNDNILVRNAFFKAALYDKSDYAVNKTVYQFLKSGMVPDTWAHMSTTKKWQKVNVSTTQGKDSYMCEIIILISENFIDEVFDPLMVDLENYIDTLTGTAQQIATRQYKKILESKVKYLDAKYLFDGEKLLQCMFSVDL